jgi:hypothetical protein
LYKPFAFIRVIRVISGPRKPIRRRLKSYGGTGEKAQSRLRRDEQYILKRFATQPLVLGWGFETTSRI